MTARGAIALAAAVAGSLGAGAVDSGQASSASQAESAQLCFPAASWSAPDHERPCYRISRPYEDGSGLLVIKADTIRSRCVIPNVHEQQPQFALRCVSRGG